MIRTIFNFSSISSLPGHSAKCPGHCNAPLKFRVCALGLLALLILSGEHIQAQEGQALFINSEGNVEISDEISAKKIKAAEVEADEIKAKVLTGQAQETLKSNIDAKLDKAGGTITGDLTVQGTVTGNIIRGSVRSRFDPMHHRMYPGDPRVYQDIFEARDKGVIKRLGDKAPYNDTTYTESNLWGGRPIIQFGGNNDDDGQGAEVSIPEGYDTLWLRVLGDRWNVIHAYFLDGNKEDLKNWTGGRRSANCYCPDGSLSDGYFDKHQWVPIPVGRAGNLALTSKPLTDQGFWLSGIAFSKNPWSHAAQSALGFHWAVNGGAKVAWKTHNWHNDILGMIGKNVEVEVPVVPSGQDKLLYLIEYNNNWNGCMHNGITVNGKKIERFISSYDNPFARHWNSKLYERYIAARIPSHIIPEDARWISVKIDMSRQNNMIHFREIGTHDLVLPLD